MNRNDHQSADKIELVVNGPKIDDTTLEFKANSTNRCYYQREYLSLMQVIFGHYCLQYLVVQACNICDICPISSGFPAWQSGWSAGMQ